MGHTVVLKPRWEGSGLRQIFRPTYAIYGQRPRRIDPLDEIAFQAMEDGSDGDLVARPEPEACDYER